MEEGIIKTSSCSGLCSP